MTERLRDNPRQPRRARCTCRASGCGARNPPAYVEKDFWVTEVLRAASPARKISASDGSTTEVLFVFKGGTSSSRVFRIIDRFSEDVDLLAVFPDGMTTTARHSILKRVDADVTAHLGLAASDVAVTSSTTGVKRYTTYTYPTDTADDDIKEGVLLELGSRGGSQPASEYPYRSLVAEHALTLGENENTWEEFIYQLLKNDRVQNALQGLGPGGIAALIDDINAHSEAAGFRWSPRPKDGYADSPAFDDRHSAAETIAAGYLGAQNLIHGAPVTLEEIAAAVSANRHIL